MPKDQSGGKLVATWELSSRCIFELGRQLSLKIIKYRLDISNKLSSGYLAVSSFSVLSVCASDTDSQSYKML